MAREEAQLDQETFDRVLAEELAKGTDRRVAEGRARRSAVQAYRAAHGEGPAAAPAAAAPGEAAATAGDGSCGSGRRRAPGAGRGLRPCSCSGCRLLLPRRRLRLRLRRRLLHLLPGTTLAPARQAPAPTGNVPEPKKGAEEKHRLLALVPPEGIQRVEREQGDRVNVWPHLLIEEFVAMLIVTVGLVIFSTFVNAPLRELANPNLTPNPSKAPWYFLGLQELLRYFHPMVAGVLFAPTIVLLALAVVPFVDRNPSTKPGDRKLAMTMFTMLMMFGATLTIIGSFFRGTGYNWVWPWAQGVFFEL